jgi:hypothetical protein
MFSHTPNKTIVWSSSYTFTIFATRSNHKLNLSPTTTRVKEIFSGLVLSTLATVWFFLLAIMYREGYYLVKGSFPIKDPPKTWFGIHFLL